METRTQRESKVSEFIKNGALFIVSTIVCLVLLEWYLRFEYAKEQATLLVKYSDRDLCTTRSDNPKLIYTYLPGKCDNNSKGYIDVEYDYDKGENTYRIVVVGDSVAEGQGVSMGESFGKVLEERLNQYKAESRAEVIILARTGYSTSQQLLLLGEEVFRYEPDMIIWSYVLNDPAHPVFHNANGELGRFFYEPELHIVHLFKRIIFILKERLAGSDCDSEYHRRLHCIYSDEVRQNIGRIGEISRASNVPVLLIIHPVFEEYGNFSNYSLKSLHDEISRVSTTAGLVTLDLLDAYRNYSATELHQAGYSDGWWDPWHPNVLGHSLVADYLYSHIIEKNPTLTNDGYPR